MLSITINTHVLLMFTKYTQGRKNLLLYREGLWEKAGQAFRVNLR